jgi:hypothetical protein
MSQKYDFDIASIVGPRYRAVLACLITGEDREIPVIHDLCEVMYSQGGRQSCLQPPF